ncbi:hypothetical protein JOL62DRAFT_625670, partial [Phyllosticta paracitricarpa]
RRRYHHDSTTHSHTPLSRCPSQPSATLIPINFFSLLNLYTMPFNTSSTSAGRVNIMAKSPKITVPAAPADAATAPADFLLQRAVNELTPFAVSILSRYMSPTGLDTTEYPILITILVTLTKSSPTEDQLIQARASYFAPGSQMLIAHSKRSIWEELPVLPWYKYAVAKTRQLAPTDCIQQQDWDSIQMERTVNADARALVAKVKRYLAAEPEMLAGICRSEGLEMFKLKQGEEQDAQVDSDEGTASAPSVGQPRGVSAGQRVLPPLQPELALFAGSKRRASEEAEVAEEREAKRARMGEGVSQRGSQRQLQAVDSHSGAHDILPAADLRAAGDAEVESAHGVDEHVDPHVPHFEDAPLPEPTTAVEEESQSLHPNDQSQSVHDWVRAQAQLSAGIEQVQEDNEHAVDPNSFSPVPPPSSSGFRDVEGLSGDNLDDWRTNSPTPSSKSPNPAVEVNTLDSGSDNSEHIDEQGMVSGTMANPLVIEDHDDGHDNGHDDADVLLPDEPHQFTETMPGDSVLFPSEASDDDVIQSSPSTAKTDELNETARLFGFDGTTDEPAKGRLFSCEPRDLTHGDQDRLKNAPISPYYSRARSMIHAGEVNVKACMCSKCRHRFSEE